MKTLLSSFLATLAVGLIAVAPPVFAETPDGGTPAEEMVCDPLREDGVTKGLYGLCVAFCEAQDIASEDVPITEAELSAFWDAAPSGRILANYNKRKQANDPDMPCILVEEPCPCWTAEELASIDGLDPYTSLSCGIDTNPTTGVIDARSASESATASGTSQVARAIDRHRTDYPTIEGCYYKNEQVSPTVERGPFRVGTDNITHEQGAACLAQVVDLCASVGI